jgi:hypothetical protein
VIPPSWGACCAPGRARAASYLVALRSLQPDRSCALRGCRAVASEWEGRDIKTRPDDHYITCTETMLARNKRRLVKGEEQA